MKKLTLLVLALAFVATSAMAEEQAASTTEHPGTEATTTDTGTKVAAPAKKKAKKAKKAKKVEEPAATTEQPATPEPTK